MLVHLCKTPPRKRSVHLVASVYQRTLRIEEDGKQSTDTELPTRALAIAELDKLVARRAKTGWEQVDRLDTPWTEWLVELEQMHARVLADATASGVAVGRSTMFQRLGPSTATATAARPPNAEIAELARVGSLRMRFQLGDDRLMHDYYFRVGVRGAGDPIWHETPDGDYEPRWGGWVTKAGIENRLDDGEIVRHASASAFRAWFPRFVRDDVLGFAIAELAPRGSRGPRTPTTATKRSRRPH